MNRLQLVNLHLLPNQTHFVLHNKVGVPDLTPIGNLKGKTVVITGGSRGIGYAIAQVCAKDGANVAILAKTAKPHPKLPGTIYTTAESIRELGGTPLPIECDIRDDEQVEAAIQKVVQEFGGIDILINNASAAYPADTSLITMKKFDLINQVNTRGTFLVSKTCIPHLLKASNPHILTFAPPLYMNKRWFAQHIGYTLSKYGMTLCSQGLSDEYQGQIGVNCLWPRMVIATSAIEFEMANAEALRSSRKPQIMADAAYKILVSDSKKINGNYFIDDEVLEGLDLTQYSVDPQVSQFDLLPDILID